MMKRDIALSYKPSSLKRGLCELKILGIFLICNGYGGKWNPRNGGARAKRVKIGFALSFLWVTADGFP